jgi:diguanylate cyclase (GGDEF)-like protein
MSSTMGFAMSESRQPGLAWREHLQPMRGRERLLALAWGLALLGLLGVFPLAHPIPLAALGLGLLSVSGLLVLPVQHRPRFYLASLLALAAVGTLTHLHLPPGSSSLVIEIVSVVVPVGVMFGDIRRDQVSSAALVVLGAVLAVTSAMLASTLNEALHSAAWSAGVIFAIAAIIAYQTRQRDLAEAALRQLRSQVYSDGLTGLRNRQGWDHDAAHIYAQAHREQRPITVAMLDADHFKPLNDRYGHAAGDLALQRIAAAIDASCRRPLDVSARIGGDEFAVIWYDTLPEQGQAMADALCRTVAALKLGDADAPHGVTLSIGLCQLVPDADQSLHLALASADTALYAAKTAGRNRVASKLYLPRAAAG